ncbi:MAG TPA: 3-deoxy-8-phosphooctulonate synthase [Rhizomicrobium sp.]|jgi:2-dehydro-3-deoxyphosphooctonate aldolase (KDO 8-P synthase)|nr:3-deoxy-8-phosphooctulonate synthase [Rhizomicrobium sp.]
MPQLHLEKWNMSMGDGQKLVVMAGLNVLEDASMAMDVAKHLKAVCAKLQLPFIFKASFDKANRSSIKSFRGPGMEKGLQVLGDVKQALKVPVITDIHTEEQATPVAAVADVVQIPAFLCRQTDLVVAAAQAIDASGGWLQIKKGQFLAPWDCKNILSKIGEVSKRPMTILCERGVSFGYNNLVVDMLGLSEMRKLGAPVTMDATHAVQLPGADPRTGGASAGGRREGVAVLARSAVAAGVDGIFLEFHPDPDKALCDGPSCLPLDSAESLLADLVAINAIVKNR